MSGCELADGAVRPVFVAAELVGDDATVRNRDDSRARKLHRDVGDERMNAGTALAPIARLPPLEEVGERLTGHVTPVRALAQAVVDDDLEAEVARDRIGGLVR